MKLEGASAYHLLDVSVDVVSHRVLRHGQDVGLPELSYRLLRALCERAPDVVTKDELVAAVWEHEAVSDETLAQRVRLLRVALGEQSPPAKAIVSVRGRGYRIAAPVTVSAEQGLKAPVADIDVYNDFLLGRHLTVELTSGSLERAAALLESVVRRAPDFAEGFCALGWAYCFLGTSYGGRAPKAVFHLAKSAVLRAISLKPGLAEAHSLYADILAWYDWDFELAEHEHRAAVAVDPNQTLGYALLLSALGRHDEAIGMLEVQLARRPDDAYLLRNLAWRLLDANRFRDAMEMTDAAADHSDSLLIKGLALVMLGKPGEAANVLRVDLDDHPHDPQRLANLSRACYLAGRRDEAVEYEHRLQEMSAHAFVSPFLLAVPRFAAGDSDAGFTLANEAVEARVREAIFLKVTTVLQPYRDDPRYHALLKRVGLPDD